MFENLYFSFNVISPIIFLSLLGYALRQTKIFGRDYFKSLNQLAFKVGFPAMMFMNMYQLESIKAVNMKLMIFGMSAVILITVYGIFAVKFITPSKKKQAVLLQDTYRSNFSLIGIPLAASAAGTAGTLAVSQMQLPVIIYFNIFTVIMLAVYTSSDFSYSKVLKKIAANPLIQGQVAGIIVLIIREFIPLNAEGLPVFTIQYSTPWLYNTISYLNRLATPAALIALGGQFEFSATSELKKEIVAGTLNRLIIVPAIGLGLSLAAASFGIIEMTPAIAIMLICLFCTPCAAASSVMAQEMGADGPLSVQMVIWTCLFSMPSLFLWIFLFRCLGCL